MADEYKKMMHHKCGPGGIKCSCCNCYHGKERKILNRLARRILKQKFNKVCNENV